MPVQFTDPKHVEGYRKAINEDPEFKIAARLMSKDVRVKVDNVECMFRIADGVLRNIKLENTYLDSWSFSISASGKSWDKFLQPVPPPGYNGLFGAMVQGLFRMEGDLEAGFAYYWAVQRMLDVIRIAHNKGQHIPNM